MGKFYRRSFDDNASSPSAVAIIDTTTDKIVRVMPTGPLPKMLATSPDNHYVAVTHWGDNTVGLIDIASDNPMNFHYVWHSVIDYKLAMNFGEGSIETASAVIVCVVRYLLLTAKIIGW